MIDKYDVIVVGGGPAGYVGAIRAAQLGISVACVDDWRDGKGKPALGGTCLNAGCIPSKVLLESSELYHRTREEFAGHGIMIPEVKLDLNAMQDRKNRIVRQLTTGINALFRANGVTAFNGRGRLLAGRQVEVAPHEGDPHLLHAEHVILAAGSLPVELPIAPFDGEYIVDSEGALEFDSPPQRLGVIGGGVIGLELGSVWNRLGSEVTILEAMDRFLFMADSQVAREAQRLFKRQGLDTRLGARVESARRVDDQVEVRFSDREGDHHITVDRLVVAVGRRPATEGLIDESAGIVLTERGHVQVDGNCRTSADGVWAIGDLVRGPMLAHKGSEEGMMVAEMIAGRSAEVNYGAIPSVIYTSPEIAWVGQTEEELQQSGQSYKVGAFNMAANGRAKAMAQDAGLAKFLSDPDTDAILGVHIVGPMAGELIQEAVLAMEFEASTEDLQRTVHGHPTLCEALHEAALSVDKRAIHAINR
ncbi:MAG: dihydrolipoyl dehydrogenase [Gammaproteobacteria bacterium]|nr:dihydrolipoyl dehydrogenase [Gammaproteobacteria bacterium]MYD02837.1 dihydrolipoyl dehydrogenase [Gammaproteobacteria bacterium]MYI24414.1 dihydrolipoyl dehydrogenase [Gammaproteobacteria bacterium]